MINKYLKIEMEPAKYFGATRKIIRAYIITSEHQNVYMIDVPIKPPFVNSAILN